MSSFLASSKLKNEIKTWLDEGIITNAQADALTLKYNLNQPPPWHAESGFWVKTVSLFLAALAFILIISQNWNQLSVTLRMLMGLVPLGVTYALAIRFFLKGETKHAELALFFATLVFGANIYLQAQIFHISSYFPNGFLLWILGALPLALYWRSPLILAIAHTAFIFYLGLEADYRQFSWYISIPLSLLFVVFTFYYSSKIHVFLLGFSLYFFLATVPGFDARGDKFFHLFFPYLVLFLNLTGLFRKKFSEKFFHKIEAIITLFIFLFLYLLTFKDTLEWFTISRHISYYFLWSLILTALLFSFFQPYSISRIICLITSIFYGVLTLISYSSHNYQTLFGILIATNIFFLGISIVKIWEGVSNKKKPAFLTGLFLILFWAIGQFTALIGNYLLTAFILIIASLVLLALNHFWNKRFHGNKTI